MDRIAEALAGLASRLGVAAAAVPVEGARPSHVDSDRAARMAIALARPVAGADDRPPLERHADGRPVWPRDVTGSIAHTDTVAVAAVSLRTERIAAVGVDVERAAALPAEDAVVVLAADERARVAAHDRPDWFATLVWSAKESAFKAWSHATDGGLGDVDPVDIVVEIDERTASLRVTAHGPLAKAVAPFGAAVGAYAEADGAVLTLVVVAPPGSAAG